MLNKVDFCELVNLLRKKELEARKLRECGFELDLVDYYEELVDFLVDRIVAPEDVYTTENICWYLYEMDGIVKDFVYNGVVQTPDKFYDKLVEYNQPATKG